MSFWNKENIHMEMIVVWVGKFALNDEVLDAKC